MSLIVKICGLRTPEALDAAIEAGADMVGFVFFAPSPRHLGLDEARALSARAAGRAQRVALTVDAGDAALAAIVTALDPDWLQLHGTETPERIAAIRARFGRPVIKAIGVSDAGDLAAASRYAETADRILYDAKPPQRADRPGGNGVVFDWTLLAGLAPARPYLLSGGLTIDNIAAALAVTGAPGIDLSSGVESSPGVKDPVLIGAFIRAAREAGAAPRRAPLSVL